MKRIFICITALILCLSNLLAQTRSGQRADSFRTSGYKWTLSYTNHYLVWQGLETSHGYMLNEHHYLGAGLGAFIAPVDGVPVYGRAFIDYTSYILNKKSTPVAGIKAGFCHAIHYSDGCKFRNAAEVEPSVGWSWTLKSGKGLSLALGAPCYLTSTSGYSFVMLWMPKLSIGLAF